MSRVRSSLLASAVFASAACADPVTHYTAVDINSATSVYFDSSPDSLNTTTGSAELSDAGSHSLAYNNGSGGYTIKPTTDDVLASASLSTGQLKAKSSLAFGTSTGAAMPLGQSNGSSSANATLADHFSTVNANSSPFLWSAGDHVSFSFAITGTADIPNVPVPASYDPGQPKDLVMASLQFTAYQPGGLELLDQLNHFDFANRPFSDYEALSDQLDAKRITGGSGFWYLGNPIAPFPVGTTPVLPVDPNTPSIASLSFNPNGDFEFTLALRTTIQLDASLDNTSATFDFSHTIQTTYTAPDGTTTLSSSGLFPNTLPLTPEPASLSLLLLPLALATRRRRR